MGRSRSAGMRCPISRGWWPAGGIWRAPTREAGLWKNPPFNGKPPATADQIGDLFVWATLGVIIGGRLGLVLFYGTFFCGISPGTCAPLCHGLPHGFLDHPIEIIAAWEGRHVVPWRAAGGSPSRSRCSARKPQAATPSRWPISSPPSRPSVCSSAASPTSSTANCGERSPTCPGRWFSAPDISARRTATARQATRHAIRASSMKRRWRASCCFVILQICLRVLPLHDRPGLLTGIFFTGYGVAAHQRSSSAIPIRCYSRMVQHRHVVVRFRCGQRPHISSGIAARRKRRREPARRKRIARADRGAGADLRLAIHDAGAARSRTWLYASRNAIGRDGRLHHRARNQPDVRRAAGPVDARKFGASREALQRSDLVELGPGTRHTDGGRVARRHASMQGFLRHWMSC